MTVEKINTILMMCTFASSLRLSVEKNKNYIECHKTSGFGTQLLCQVGAFAVARHDSDTTCFKYFSFDASGLHDRNKKYPFDPKQFTGLKTDDECESVTKGARFSTTKSKPHGFATVSEGPDAFYTQKVRDELRSLYDSTPKPARDESCQVAVHVRRGDMGDAKSRRNHGCDHCDERWTDAELIVEAVEHFGNKSVCVFSEGRPKDLKQLEAKQNVKIILDGAVTESFNNFVTAPELVIAHSHFSYSAALYNTKGKIYYYGNFWLKPLQSWMRLDASNDKSFAAIESKAMPEDLMNDFD